MRVRWITSFHSSNPLELFAIAYVVTIGITNINIHPPYLVENATPPNNEAIKNRLKEYFSANFMHIKIVARINVCSKGFGRTCVLHIRNWGIVRKHSVPMKAIVFESNNFLDIANNIIPLMAAENILINLQVTNMTLSLSPKK